MEGSKREDGDELPSSLLLPSIIPFASLYVAGLTLISGTLETLVTIPLLFLYVAYATPLLIVIEANLLNDAFQVCGLPPAVQFAG